MLMDGPYPPRPSQITYGLPPELKMARPPAVPAAIDWTHEAGMPNDVLWPHASVGPPVDEVRVGAPPGRVFSVTSHSVVPWPAVTPPLDFRRTWMDADRMVAPARDS